MSELKPCPFCGGMAHIAYNAKRKIYGKDEYRTGVAIYCGVCEARMFYISEKLAIEAWNRRAGDTPTIEPDWDEILVICDNCGHAIHVKREEGQEE